jgi:hypothetical protein
MLTQRVEVGREECSRQDRISALKANFPSFILKTYTVLVAIFSWAISTWKKKLYTFDVPIYTKPGYIITKLYPFHDRK